MAGGSGRGHEHLVPVPPPSRRHCWVTGTRDSPGPHSSLVLAWDKRDGRRFAQVIYYVEADGVVVQQWLPADLLTGVG